MSHVRNILRIVTSCCVFSLATELLYPHLYRLLGMRVANVYDIDQKTYLIKLAK